MTEKMIRIQILRAAEIRFTQYGFGKTTMAEIARDCDMTAGNLYRYFENKLEIGAGIALFYFDEEYKALEKIVDQKDITAAQKLEDFVLHALRHCHGYFTKAPRVIELVQEMEVKKPCVCDAHQAEKVRLLAKLLIQAEESDEFAVDNVEATAAAIHMGLIAFQYPPFMARFSLEEMEANAKKICQLIVTGLQKVKEQ